MNTGKKKTTSNRILALLNEDRFSQKRKREKHVKGYVCLHIPLKQQGNILAI